MFFRSTRRFLVGAALLASLVSVASPAPADVASWLYVGAGPSLVGERLSNADQQLSLQVDTGFGSPPGAPVILGGLARVQPHFGQGIDLGLLLRGAMGSYQRGDWGAAIDIGGYQRWWGAGSTGLLGGVSLGGPFGLTANLTAGFGTNDAQMFSGTFGIDFARLTIYRTAGQNWWRNPYPSPRERDF